MKHRSANGALLAAEKHYYDGWPTASTGGPVTLSWWKDGKEFKTELFDGDGTTVLRRVEHTWEPRVTRVVGEDPQITETKTTLVDTNQVAKQSFGYDQFNNHTDVWEYDYGDGAPGPLRRHTRIDFLTTNPVNGIDYTATNGAHIRDLPTSVRVMDGADATEAYAETRYDEPQYPPLWYGEVSGWSDPGAARGNATTTRRWLDTTGGGYLDTCALRPSRQRALLMGCTQPAVRD